MASNGGGRGAITHSTVTAVALVLLMVGAAFAPPAAAAGATTAAEANSAATTGSVDAAATANVSGTVVGPDGTALSGDGLSFFANRSDNPDAQTDDTGDYSVSVTAGTTYEVQYYQLNGSGGLFPRDGVADIYAVANRSYADGDVQNVTVPRGNQLDVTVEDEAGDPVENVSVDVVHLRDGASVPISGTTDANGVWTPDDAATAGVEVNGSVFVVGGPENDTYETAFRELTVDADRSVTLTLSESNRVTVNGSVTYPNESAAVNDSVLLLNRSTGDTVSVTTDDAGSFSASVHPNTTYRVAYWQGPVQRDSTTAFPRDGVADFAVLDTVTTANDTARSFTVPSGSVLNVTVEDGTGSPLEDARVGLRDVNVAPGISFYGYRSETGPPTDAMGRMVHPPNGRPGVEVAGEVQVSVTPPPNTSYDGNGTSLTVDGPQDVTLTLERPTNVTGSIVDANGDPVTNGTVVAGGENLPTYTARLNDSGGFTIPDAEPGTYSVGLIQTETIGVVKDGVPDVYFFARVDATGEVTDVGEQSLPAAHVVNVSVADGGGDPIPRATVLVGHRIAEGVGDGLPIPANESGVLRAPNATTPGIELAGNVSLGATRPRNSTAYAPERNLINDTVEGPRDYEFTVNRTAVSPRSVSFPSTAAGGTATETVTVTNNGDGPMEVAGASVDSPAYTVTSGGGSFVLEPGTSHEVTVEFAPSSTGTYDGELAFENPEPSNGPPLTVSLAGTTTGSNVTGSIVDANGDPVTNGTVVAGGENLPTYDVRLNDSGGFALTNVEPGTYDIGLIQTETIGVVKDGVPDVYIIDRVNATDDRALGSAPVPSASVVDVSVTDGRNEPVPGATVVVAHTPAEGVGDAIPLPANESGVLRAPNASSPGIELAGNVSVGATRPRNSTAYAPERNLINDTVDGAESYEFTVNRTAVSQRSVSFPYTGTNDTATETVTVTNNGDDPMSVAGASVDSPAFAVENGGAFTLAPGESHDVTVRFDPAEPRTYDGALVFGNPEPSNGPPLTVPLSGTAATANVTGSLQAADGSPVANGTVILGGPEVPTYTAALNDSGGYAVADVEPGTYAVSLLQNGTMGTPDGVPDFYITGPFTVGDGTADLGVQTLPQGHVVDVTVEDGVGAPVESALVAVAHTPESGIGDGIPFQTDANGTLQPFSLTDDFELPNDVTLADAEPGDGVELAGNVTLAAEPPLNSTAYTPAPAVRNATLSGPANYTLTLARTAVSPGSVSFPDTDTDSTATETVTVTNDGVAPLAVNDTVVEGSSAYAVTSGGGPFSLEPGESREVTVEFAPSSTGTAEGELVFANPEPAFGPPLTVPLSGEGVEAGGGGGGGGGVVVDDDDGTDDTTTEENVTDDGNATDGGNDTGETGASSVGVDQSDVDFGTTTVGNATTASVTVTNGGNATGTVTSVGTRGDAAFVTSAGSRTLDPGETSTLRVRFDPSEPGTFDGELVVNTADGGSSTVGLSGSAEGVPAVAVEPTGVEFGSVATGAEVQSTVVVRNVGTGPLSLAAAASGDNGTFALADDTPDALAPGESARTTLTFSADAPGAYEGAVEFDTNDTDRGTVTVSAAATAVESDLGIEPGSLSFEDTRIRNATTLSVTVSNTGNAPANLTEVDVSGSDADAFAVVAGGGAGTLAAGESRTVEVEFAPASTGAKAAQLGIETDAGTRLDVPLSGTATRPRLAVSRSSVDFGNVTLGDAVTTTVTLSNRGDGTLRVANADVVGADPGSFELAGPTTPVTLEPGEQRTVTLGFEPTTAGTKSAILKLRTNDPRRPVTSVWLSNTNTRVEIDATEENDTSQVSIDVNNASADSSVAVNVSTPESRDDRASVDEVNLSVERGGNYSLNVTSDDERLDTTGEFTPNETNNTAAVGYVNVSHTVADENISRVSFTFRVSKASVEARNVSPEDVVLHRKVDGEWTRLETTLVGETATHYRYRGVSPGLSDFVAAVNQPQFELVDAAVSISEVRVGEAAGVEVTIDNTGRADGAFTANLLLDDTVVDRKTVTVAADSRRVLVFEQEIDQAGTYSVEVNNVTAGRVNVTDPNADGGNDTGADGGGSGDGGGSDGGGSDGGSSTALDGFGALPALVALVALAFAALRRRGRG
ncbi:choice-of-anchor D domain-containing protein [Halostella litorea]|uniref:choice-of-anchor D domain-containing protein n=1 Tax=Halostella litorea TaxID=2528831 RepID=UPI0013869D16|nr:choice-of-anchor D domain-containing protein [Halostella litorea]